MADSALAAAIRAVKSGLSANAGLEQARAGGLAIRRQTWLRMVGEVRRSLADQIDEVTRPLNRRPLAHEVQPYTSRYATGYLQHVDIMVRDKATGLVRLRPYSIRTRKLMSRGYILKKALASFQRAIDTNSDEYPEEVLGAVYTSTYEYTPTGE